MTAKEKPTMLDDGRILPFWAKASMLLGTAILVGLLGGIATASAQSRTTSTRLGAAFICVPGFCSI